MLFPLIFVLASLISGTAQYRCDTSGTQYRCDMSDFLLNFYNLSRNGVFILENRFFDEDLTVTKHEKARIFPHASWGPNDPLDGLLTPKLLLSLVDIECSTAPHGYFYQE